MRCLHYFTSDQWSVLKLKPAKSCIDTQLNWVKLQMVPLSNFQQISLLFPSNKLFFVTLWAFDTIWMCFFYLQFCLQSFSFSLSLCIATLNDFPLIFRLFSHFLFISGYFINFLIYIVFFIHFPSMLMYCPIKFIFCPSLNDICYW